MKIFKHAEWVVSILLTAAILILLITRARHAGGLWRDECASLQVAVMPAIGDLFANYQRESFPAFFYLVLRAYTGIAGTNDIALRCFGLAVGVLLLAVAWINSRLLHNEPPLISILLMGFNTTFLIWGTTIRGYGIGSIFILLTFGLIAKLLVTPPTASQVGPTLVAALLSVQLLLYNSVILLALGIAFVSVSLTRRRLASGIAMVGIGGCCVISMLPYLGPFWRESVATVVLRGETDIPWLWTQLQAAFGNPPHLMTSVWIGQLLAATGGAVFFICSRWSKKPFPEWDLLFFGSFAWVSSLVGYVAFLEIIRYGPREWYYLALLAIFAGSTDLLVAILSHINWIRLARLCLATAGLIGFSILAWPQVMQRQTNMDLIARTLEKSATGQDLIVTNPWYYGVSFNWYYHGSAPWVSVPEMNDHHVHRFDLLKARMMASNPIDDLFDKIAITLRGGNRVWFVGGVEFIPPGEGAPNLPPAPYSDFRWSMDAYAELWSQQIGVFLRDHASGGRRIHVPTNGPVIGLENPELLVISGWRE